MRNRIYLPLLFILTSLILSACGGGSSSNSTPTAITGSYSDAGAVSGLQYSTATQSGTTDSSGKFLYLPGETVTFSVGSIVIGKAVAAPTLTTFDLVGISAPLTSLGIPNNIPSSLLFQQAINISTFLQTLDSDGNVNNGISIPSQAIVLSNNTALTFKQKYFNFQNSFTFKNFIGRCRTAGIWSGSRVIVSSGYAANLLYAGLGLAPKLYAMIRADSGTNGYSLFTYDANGNLTQNKTFDGNGVLQSSYAYAYDANGNQTLFQYINGSGVLQLSTTNTYDANGNVTQSKSFDSSSVLQLSITFTYDANGNETQNKTFDGNGVLQSSTTNTYDANGNGTQAKSFNGSGVLQWSTTNTYDANGNLAQSKSFDSSGLLQSSTTNTYDANGNLTSYQYIDSSGVLQLSTTFTYDANGNRTLYQYFNGSGLLQSSTTFTYDANGNVTQIKSFDASGVLLFSSTYTNSASSVWTQIFRNLKGGGPN